MILCLCRPQPFLILSEPAQDIEALSGYMRVGGLLLSYGIIKLVVLETIEELEEDDEIEESLWKPEQLEVERED